MKYTVILLYPDHATDDFGGETWISTIEAANAPEAIAATQKKAAEQNEVEQPEDFRMLAVFIGEPTLILRSTHP
jgi:hypothetical protein